jgi:hypothetical protein
MPILHQLNEVKQIHRQLRIGNFAQTLEPELGNSHTMESLDLRVVEDALAWSQAGHAVTPTWSLAGRPG